MGPEGQGKGIGSNPRKAIKRTFYIVGTGRFGKKAALHLMGNPYRKVVCVDKDPLNMKWAMEHGLPFLGMDGVSFLLEKLPKIAGEDIIVPALPIHLAAHWFLTLKSADHDLSIVPIPDSVIRQLPNPSLLEDMSCAVSYADFRCPEGCKEPPTCPVTHRPRKTPLFKALGEIGSNNWYLHVLQSRQLGPGMGGYSKSALEAILDIPLSEIGKFIIGTACSCHGILTAIEIRK